MVTATCPSCEGTLNITAQNSKMVTCNYCSMISYINAGNLTMIGQKSFFVDYGSMLKLGKKGKIYHIDIEVIGRLRIDYEDGFFDEWYLNTPQSTKWLSEDEGKFLFFTDSKTLNDPTVLNLPQIIVGSFFEFQGLKLFIKEQCNAKINGGEGELPFKIQPNQPVNFVDCLYYQKLYSFEFLNEIELHIGDYIDINHIKILS